MNGRDIWDHYHPVVKPTKERKAKAEKSSHVRGADLSAMF
jgi:hypothetical protein